jgi:hypothetical protein
MNMAGRLRALDNMVLGQPGATRKDYRPQLRAGFLGWLSAVVVFGAFFLLTDRGLGGLAPPLGGAAVAGIAYLAEVIRRRSSTPQGSMGR